MRKFIKSAAVIAALSTSIFSSPVSAQGGISRLSDITEAPAPIRQSGRQVVVQPPAVPVAAQSCTPVVDQNGRIVGTTGTCTEAQLRGMFGGAPTAQPTRPSDDADNALRTRGRVIRQDVTAELAVDLGHTLIGGLAGPMPGRGGYYRPSYSTTYGGGWGRGSSNDRCDPSVRAC